MSVDLLLRRRALMGDDGGFSVSANQRVQFSSGNLEYQASTNTWRFAQDQRICIGESNSNISPTYDGWIDLFGYGTSGYDNGQVCYMPTSISELSEDYYDDNLVGNSDWGYNQISNGGNVIGMWRTLTWDEWQYLLFTRNTESGYRFVKASVLLPNSSKYVSGLIIFPDNWEVVYPIYNVNVDSASFVTFAVSSSAWEERYERLGCVFLVTGGLRSGTTMYNLGTRGYYWTSTYGLIDLNVYYAYGVKIQEDCIERTYLNKFGMAVRLVRNIS